MPFSLYLNKLYTLMNNLLFSVATITANAFGIFAIICKILEYQVKKRNVMFTLATIANVCWVLYFVFLSNIASSFTCIINVIKLLIFMQRGNYKWAESIWWLILFLILQVLVTIFTVASWVDVFCITAGFLGVLAYFFKNARTYRILSFIHMAIWVANSIANFYPIALISDTFSTVSCGVAIVRYDIIKQKPKKIDQKQSIENNQQSNLEDKGCKE
ncbi:MAG: YgjV family protein [Clostridia bacterium]|nr:YgjV family protein [Clostridia bacterium]